MGGAVNFRMNDLGEEEEEGKPELPAGAAVPAMPAPGEDDGTTNKSIVHSDPPRRVEHPVLESLTQTQPHDQPGLAITAAAPDVLADGIPKSTVIASSLLETFRPPKPSPLFTGRVKELEYMNNFFRENAEGELIMRGVARSGKTQLALKFAQMIALH